MDRKRERERERERESEDSGRKFEFTGFQRIRSNQPTGVRCWQIGWNLFCLMWNILSAAAQPYIYICSFNFLIVVKFINLLIDYKLQYTCRIHLTVPWCLGHYPMKIWGIDLSTFIQFYLLPNTNINYFLFKPVSAQYCFLASKWCFRQITQHFWEHNLSNFGHYDWRC